MDYYKLSQTNKTNIQCWGCKYLRTYSEILRFCGNIIPCINNDEYQKLDTFSTNRV